MGKYTLRIEDEDFELEFSDPQILKLTTQTGKAFDLEIVEVNYKGFGIKTGATSSNHFWWENPQKYPLYICSICGQIHERGYSEPYGSKMEQEHLCFSCAIWTLYTEKENPTVIDGSRYTVGEEGNFLYKGFGGRKFRIEYFSGEIVETTNLWHQGEVPAHFRDKIPDTAKFIRSN